MEGIARNSIIDEGNQAVLVIRHIHHIEVFPQELFDLLHLGDGHHLPLGNTGSADFTLFPEHIRQLGIVRLNGVASVFNRHLLFRNQPRSNSGDVDFTPSVRHRLLTALHIRHRGGQISSVLHFQVLFHLGSGIPIGFHAGYYLFCALKNGQNIRFGIRVLGDEIQFAINMGSSLYSLPGLASYSAGSRLPYQKSSKTFITSPSSNSVCDVTSAARVLQVAKLHKPGRQVLLISAV